MNKAAYVVQLEDSALNPDHRDTVVCQLHGNKVTLSAPQKTQWHIDYYGMCLC